MDMMENDGNFESIYMNVEQKSSNQTEIYSKILLGTINENTGKKREKKKKSFTYT